MALIYIGDCYVDWGPVLILGESSMKFRGPRQYTGIGKRRSPKLTVTLILSVERLAVLGGATLIFL